MNNLGQIFISCSRALKKDSASRKGFSLTPEEQLKFQSILYWFIDFPEYGKYFTT